MFRHRSYSRFRGFTIVELLVVIVVIGILVTIVTINWSGAQARSRDSKRLADAKAIEAALESYRSNNTGYPASSTATQVGGAATAGWEASGASQPGTFMSAIEPFGFTSGVAVDPTNDSLTWAGKVYRYATYAAGTNGCDVSKGDYYVFMINDIETVSGAAPQSPGFSCPGRNWQPEGDYVVGHFVNE
jgi:prepilin-type N-terminal cleavage/methylation domain-containing protein